MREVYAFHHIIHTGGTLRYGCKEGYACGMNTRNTIIGIIVLIILAVGVYFIVQSSNSASMNNQQATTTPQTTTASTTADQVQAQDVTVGTGAAAQPGNNVAVLYVGYIGTISTSTVFDSSAAHGNKPLTFQLGAQGLIPGFQIGVNGMKVGGERLMAIPPSLGYGTQDVKDASGKVIIPAGSTIIFDVKLVDVSTGSSTTPTTGTTNKAK